MDILSVAGVILAIVAIIGGNFLEGGHIGSLIQVTAMVIVAGGTVGAIMIQSAMSVFMRSLKMGMWVIFPPKLAATEAIEKIINWSNIARKEGLLGLEALTENEPDLFARKGLQLLVDGSEPETIRGIMEVEMGTKEHHDTQAAKVYEGMGGYSPTIGIIGAVMGLIHVMENLADPSKLGSGIAVAFVATIYGVGMANLFFLPMANKLKALIHNQTQFRKMNMSGMPELGDLQDPRSALPKLQGYMH